MKKIIVASILICIGVVGVLIYTVLNNPMDTLNYATWDKVPQDTKEFFADIKEGSIGDGEKFYRTYFMKFNPVHEVGHAIREKYDIQSSMYEEEQSVNDIAVAYWREVGEEEFINDLEIELKEALSKMERPIPEGVDPGEYFNENYHTLGDDPNLYGYFQFTFVLNSIEKSETLHEALQKNIGNQIKDKKDVLEYDIVGVSAADPKDVVGNFVQYLKLYNVDVPDIKFNNKFRTTIQSID